MTKTIIGIALTLFFCDAYAQRKKSSSKKSEESGGGIEILNSSENRLEFELKKKNAGNYRTENLDEDGLLISFDSDEKGEDKTSSKLYFLKISTELQEEYSVEVNVKARYDLAAVTRDGDNFYYMYANESGSDVRIGGREMGPGIQDYQILRFNFRTQENDIVSYRFPKKIVLTQFWVKDGYLYMTGRGQKSGGTMCMETACLIGCCYIPYLFGMGHEALTKPYFISINLADQKQKVDMWKTTKSKSIAVIDVDTGGGKSTEMLVTEKVKKLTNVYVMHAEEGDFTRAHKLNFKAGLQPFSMKSTTFSETDKRVAGLFSAAGDAYTTRGIYFGEMKDGRLDNVSFIPYKELKNAKGISDWASNKKIEKSKKKKKKEDAKVALYMYTHAMYMKDDNYMLIGEFYYPTYRTETRTTYSNGKMTTTTVTVFDGYQYSSVLVMCFSPEGKLLWDKALSLSEMSKSYSIRERVKILNDENDNLVFAYIGKFDTKKGKKTSTDHKIVYASFDGEEFSDKATVDITSAFEFDNVKEGSDVNINYTVEYWHGNDFVAYGSQTITNKKQKGRDNKRRTVFFINRVPFE